MKMPDPIFYLKIQKVEKTCLFELSWGSGQSLTVQIEYPAMLTQLYQQWEQAYLQFYRSDHFRGRAVGGGIAAMSMDWRAELIQAETRLMYEFHRWLRGAELYELRSRLATASREQAITDTTRISVFLTCSPIELDRLPWEDWEIEGEFTTQRTIAFLRSPLNIRTAPDPPVKRRRTRILAILGDDTGLDFAVDRAAVTTLSPMAEIQFVGWQPQQTSEQVIQQIRDEIVHQQGWDILFFAGHSNETVLTGGELGVAPGVSIRIQEITPQLTIAKQRGLQVAIFNSCRGLSIAESLINIGFSQVVVMREPIHNRVSQEFLVHFLHALRQNADIYDAIFAARQFLRMEKSHTYPSTSLVPSLFCHPGADLFRIPTRSWLQPLRQMLPTSLEAIALTTTVLLSLLHPVQDTLLTGRLFIQAIYRDLTQQTTPAQTPPVALIQIDTESIARSRITQIHPLDRRYLSQIVDRLRQVNASVIGFDVLLDSPQAVPADGDRALGTAVRRIVDRQTWIIFAAILEPEVELGVNEQTGIASLNWALQGYTDAHPHWVELPSDDCRSACPIAYLMALIQAARQAKLDLPIPKTQRTQSLRSELMDQLEKHPSPGSRVQTLLKARSPFNLQPLVDFSLPPERVYTTIPAWKLLNSQQNVWSSVAQQIVLVAAGSDDRLGTGGQGDRFEIPLAMGYWQPQQRWLTGGEALAYMTHHHLNGHLIIPIPDIWMIGGVILVGKLANLLIIRGQYRIPFLYRAIGMSLPLMYGGVSLQLYISGFVLLPWLFPSVLWLIYVVPIMWRKEYA